MILQFHMLYWFTVCIFNSNTTNGKCITEVYIAAAKCNEILNKRDPAVLMRSVEANQHAFICERGTFTNLLTHYHGSYRCIVAGILHDIFPRLVADREGFQLEADMLTQSS